jgi:hypothetical protein
MGCNTVSLQWFYQEPHGVTSQKTTFFISYKTSRYPKTTLNCNLQRHLHYLESPN